MALKAKDKFNFAGSGVGSQVGMQGLVPINLAGQTVSAATGGRMAVARGLLISTGGTISVIPVGNDAVITSLPVVAGKLELEITEVVAAGSASVVGHYYF